MSTRPLLAIVNRDTTTLPRETCETWWVAEDETETVKRATQCVTTGISLPFPCRGRKGFTSMRGSTRANETTARRVAHRSLLTFGVVTRAFDNGSRSPFRSNRHLWWGVQGLVPHRLWILSTPARYHIAPRHDALPARCRD